MGQIGDAFPVEFRKREMEHRLVPGAVLYLEMSFPEVTKNKFVVLVATSDPDMLTFMVNTETSDYIRQRPELNVCQVTIDQDSHDFLSYDSKIACHQVHKLRKDDVLNALIADSNRFKGNISLRVKNDILSAVKHATTLSKVNVRSILKDLE